MSKNFHNLIILSLFSILGVINAMENQPEIAEGQNFQPIQAIELKTGVGCIKEIKYNAIGDKLAVIGQNCNFAEVWNINTGELVCRLMGHKEAITCLDWHPNISLVNALITGSEDVIKLWDIGTGACKKTFRIPKKVINHKSSVTTLSFTHAIPSIFISGHSNGLPCIRFFKDNSQNPILISRLDYTGKTAPIYHTSFQKSGILVCVATNDGIIKIFEQPKGFSKQNFNQPWIPKLRYQLDSKAEKLVSFAVESNHVFLRIKNIETGAQNCNILNLKQGTKKDSVLDYCEKTNNCLSLLSNYKLFESSFNRNAKDPAKQIFRSNSPIKSAIYNASGNQIFVSTDEGQHILQQKDAIWHCIYNTSTESEILLHPANNVFFISKKDDESGTISILKSIDAMESDESVNIETESTIQNDDESIENDTMDFESVSSSKRSHSEVAEQSKTPKSNKRRKIISQGLSDTDLDNSEEETFEFVEEDESNDSFLEPVSQTQTRGEKERAMLLAMYDLITTSQDDDILKKSLIEIMPTQSDEVIQKYLDCTVNCNLNQQDNHGRTALFIATDSNKELIVKLLAERGADVNIANNQEFSPFHIAIKKGYLAIAKYLIAKQALINKQTIEGETALHLAIKNMDLDAIKAILASDNVNLNLLDNNSNSILGLVIASKNPELIKLFGPKLKQN